MKNLIKFLVLLLPFSLFANQGNRIFDTNLEFINPNCNLFSYSFVNGNQHVVKYTFSPLEFYDGEIDVIIENVNTGELITNFIHINNGTSSRTIDWRNCSIIDPNFCVLYINSHFKIYITYKNCLKTIDIYF